MASLRVLLLPGGVLPADLAYGGLMPLLGADVDARAKDLELYREDEPPADYNLDTEVDGIRRFADQAGFEQFHLVGYSGGGACALAFCAQHPDRVLSLVLNEPAWGGNEGWSEEERRNWAREDEIMALPPEEAMPAFMRNALAPGVEPPPPPPGPPPPWFGKRPAGLRALTAAFKAYDLDLDRLRAFDRPVLYVLGGKSNPVANQPIANRLEQVFPDFTREVFEDRHHFDPPHRAEPERFARLLRQHWERAENSAPKLRAYERSQSPDRD